jgi:hypothetical protein
MSLYVAGGSSERLDVIRPLMDRARAAGVEIAHDWTTDPGWDLGRPPTVDELGDAARRDIAGILAARVFWLVVPAAKSEGAAAETGFMLASLMLAPGPRPRHLIVSGEIGARNIFALLASEYYPTHEEALARVVALLGRR